MKEKRVRIGKQRIPVKTGRVIASFSAGRMGKSERGLYHFWTAYCEVPRTRWQYWRSFFKELWKLRQEFKASNIEMIERVKRFGRARVKLDAGERFRRIEHETHREAGKAWRELQFVKWVRPSTCYEVAYWLATHQEDAPYLTKLEFKK